MLSYLAFYTVAFFASIDLSFSLDCGRCIAACDSASRGSFLDWSACQFCLPHCGNLSNAVMSFFIENQCISREAFRSYEQSANDMISLLNTIEAMKREHDGCRKNLDRCQSLLRNEQFDVTHTFESNKHRFINTEELESRSRDLEEMAQARGPIAKTNGIYLRDQPQAPTHREACPTKYKIAMPKEGKHLSGYTVSMWLHKSYEQYFFIGKCRRTYPVIRMHPQGRCKVTQNLYKAMFLINQQMYDDKNAKFHNCRVAIAHLLYLCDDWVYLDSACSLFI